MVRWLKVLIAWLTYLLINDRLIICPKNYLLSTECIYFPTPWESPLPKNISKTCEDRWSWGFYLVNISKPNVFRIIVSRLWSTHAHYYESYDQNNLDSKLWLLTNKLIELLRYFCLVLIQGFPSWHNFLSLELLGSSNKLVGGYDECSKVYSS